MTLAETRTRREGKKTPSSVPPLVGNQYFKVYFGPTPISFSRVSNVQHRVEHEDLVEGGLNQYVHVLTKTNSQSGTITLEKGVIAEDLATKTLRATLFMPGRRILLPIVITLYHRTDNAWVPARSWGVEDGIVTSCELSELDGMGSQVAVEKLEISHSGLLEIW